MYQKVFRRNENKYLLTPAQKHSLLKSLQTYLEPDNYFQTTICSLYLDTVHSDLIVKSIEKPVFKQKVRLRSYGVPTDHDKVFLEIKYKFRGVVSKRRIKLSLVEFNQFYHQVQKRRTKPRSRSRHYDSQIMRELDYLFSFYQLQPACIICYDRESYRAVSDPDLRITFDNNLRSRDQDLHLEHGDYGADYFQDHKCIMEIKALSAMPLWLVRTLSELQIYPASFTKYGKVYEQSKKGVLC